MFPDTPCQQNSCWAELQQQAQTQKTVISDLLKDEPSRLQQLGCELPGIYLDLSRQSFSLQQWQLLCNFADSRNVRSAVDSWMRGDEVNTTEQRSVLHQVYRHTKPLYDSWPCNMTEEIERMKKVATQVRQGVWQGANGKPVNTIINIGIGGSHLGIEAVYNALAGYRAKGIKCLFVANIDPQAIKEALQEVDLARSIVVISSKSATTLEPLSNFQLAREACSSQGIKDFSRHLFGITSKKEKFVQLGIPEQNIFGFPDTVGGRFSVWSPISFALECCIDSEAMESFRAGAAMIDEHTITAQTSQNMPVMLALASLWQHALNGIQHHAILAYSHALRGLVQHFQQLIMESNGKSVAQNGESVVSTGEIIWGGENCNGQHSYFQLLHQGNQPQHCDAIIFARSLSGNQAMQDDLVAMGLGQVQALVEGNPDKDKHKATPGNRPITTILCKQPDAYTIGALLALYENRTIIHAILLGINPFDQWGVEFGKKMANALSDVLNNKGVQDSIDASTKKLVEKVQSYKQ